MVDWKALVEELYQALDTRFAPLGRSGVDASESLLGPVEGMPTTDALRAFRACEPRDAAELSQLLKDRRSRLLVKLLVLATQTVPRPLFAATVWAGIDTLNPSYNKHYIWPCAIQYGRRAVLEELKRITLAARAEDRTRAAGALYWCSMPVAEMYWPDSNTIGTMKDRPVEDVADLIGELESIVRG